MKLQFLGATRQVTGSQYYLEADGVRLLVVGVALALLGLIAYLAGRKEKDTRDFFLGGRNVPTFIATLSFVAAEISALTVIGVMTCELFSAKKYLERIGLTLLKKPDAE